MFFPEELVEEVRARNDIIDIISSYIRLQKKGSNHMGLCPFHNERTPSFSVSASKQLYHCFGCGVGGNAFTFIMEYENFTFVEAVKFLADRSGIELPEKEYSQEAKKQADIKGKLLDVNKEAAKYFYYQLKSSRGQASLDYLRDRGFSDEIIHQFGIGYSNKTSDDLYLYLKSLGYEDEFLKTTGLVTLDERRGGSDKFWNRVMFPIMDINNRVIGFGGRVMGDGMPKYLNSPETLIFDKSRNLYGLNLARKSRQDHIIISEGYLDVMALNQAGFDNVVASLGTAFTGFQAKLLTRYTKEIFLAYDSDVAGVKASLRAIDILKEVGMTVKVIGLEPYKDPDDFIKYLGGDEFQKRIEEAKSSFFFEIDVLKDGYDMEDPQEKTKFFKEIAHKLLQFPDELERKVYIDAVARAYHIDVMHLQRLVNKLGSNMVVGVREIKSTRTGENVKNKAENSISRSQRLLLTWLIEDTSLFNRIKDIIMPSDFTEDIYGEVAKQVFLQFTKDNQVVPAKIINHFESKDEQSEVAALFSAKISGEMNEEEKEKALKDTILRVKENSLDKQSLKAIEANDARLLQQIHNERASLKDINLKNSD